MNTNESVCDKLLSLNGINEMIVRIAEQKNAFFKSQQKDETDLTLSEKRSIVEQLFNQNKDIFLQRYGIYLTEEELKLFDELSDNYVIDCHLKNFRKLLDKNNKKSVIKNRRFEAMKRLIESGDYFSETQMQSRNPFLFEQMIGQYMTEREKTQFTANKYQQNYDTITFSSFLLEQIENSFIDRRFQFDQQMEDNVREEFDSDDSDGQLDESYGSETNRSLDSNEKNKLRDEFKKIMCERFLSGKDSDFFDYNKVDYSLDYDSHEIQDRDEEEEYFDAEDSHSLTNS